MNSEILELINSSNASLDSLIRCLEIVKRNGDVVVVKLDGQRSENQYTAFITFPDFKKRPLIRADEASLREALLEILKAYTDNTL